MSGQIIIGTRIRPLQDCRSLGLPHVMTALSLTTCHVCTHLELTCCLGHHWNTKHCCHSSGVAGAVQTFFYVSLHVSLLCAWTMSCRLLRDSTAQLRSYYANLPRRDSSKDQQSTRSRDTTESAELPMAAVGDAGGSGAVAPTSPGGTPIFPPRRPPRGSRRCRKRRQRRWGYTSAADRHWRTDSTSATMPGRHHRDRASQHREPAAHHLDHGKAARHGRPSSHPASHPGGHLPNAAIDPPQG